MNPGTKTAAYVSDIGVASMRAPLYTAAIAAGWIAFPFALQTVLHPADAIKLQFKLQGVPLPHVLTAQQLGFGEFEAVASILVLVLVQMVCTVLYYRKAQMHGASAATPALWPVSALLAGIFGNLAWCVALGTVDFTGCLIGFSWMALTVGGEILTNKLGKKFVLGPAAMAAPAALFPVN
jgi:hypothetical protein